VAVSGQVLENPITGQTLSFRRTTAETGGDLLEVESSWPPQSVEPVEHFHPHQSEHFEVLEGELHVEVDGEHRVLRAGDTLDVPARTRHAMSNRGPGRARALWQTRPALKTEAFFETIWGLAQDGKVNSKGVPNPLHLAVLLREYDDEFRVTKPPPAVQSVLFAVLAPIGRLLGYRGRYEARAHS
jgi:mannose-6-phosphate isomerase-like protein (cupin superfamily)